MVLKKTKPIKLDDPNSVDDINRRWFEKHRQQFQFTCVTKLDWPQADIVRPKYPRFIRAPFGGETHWGFKKKEVRDAFAKEYQGRI